MLLFFFFKQKTAYDVRISDWSSDVCSSDLVSLREMRVYQSLANRGEMPMRITAMADGDSDALAWLCREGPYQHPSHRLKMRTVKLYVDGALGSRSSEERRGGKGCVSTCRSRW